MQVDATDGKVKTAGVGPSGSAIISTHCQCWSPKYLCDHIRLLLLGMSRVEEAGQMTSTAGACWWAKKDSQSSMTNKRAGSATPIDHIIGSTVYFSEMFPDLSQEQLETVFADRCVQASFVCGTLHMACTHCTRQYPALINRVLTQYVVSH